MDFDAILFSGFLIGLAYFFGYRSGYKRAVNRYEEHMLEAIEVFQNICDDLTNHQSNGKTKVALIKLSEIPSEHSEGSEKRP